MTYSTTKSPVTLQVRDSFPIATFGGETVYAPFATMSPAMLVTLIEEGAQRILRDGTGAKDLTDTERAAKMRKRIDAWMQGNFTIKDRDPALATMMRECYVADQLAKHDGATVKQIEEAMRETVKKQLGDVNATFDNFLKAIAKQVAATKGETRSADELYEALAAKWETEGRALAADRAAAAKSVKVDLTDIGI